MWPAHKFLMALEGNSIPCFASIRAYFVVLVNETPAVGTHHHFVMSRSDSSSATFCSAHCFLATMTLTSPVDAPWTSTPAAVRLSPLAGLRSMT